MLFGTSLLFRVAYFFTAFSPALLFISFSFRYEAVFCTQSEIINEALQLFTYWLPPIVVALASFVFAKILKRYLIKRAKDRNCEVSNMALNFNVSQKKFKKAKEGYVIQIQEGVQINSGFVKFAISIVAPRILLTLIGETSAMLPFMIIVSFFLLLMFSNDTFPNVILPIIGVHLMVTKDNYNIFYLSENKEFLNNVKKLHSLGSAGSLSRTYILSRESFPDAEIADMEEK